MVVVYNIEEANMPGSRSVIPEKLKRMPHLFDRVLELPVPPDTNVRVHETPGSFIFKIQQSGLVAADMRVEVLEIVPGAIKVVVIGGAEVLAPGLEVDCWRYRLPPVTFPEATRVVYEDEVLVVTVPKLAAGSVEHRCDSKVLVEPEIVELGS